MTVHRLVADRRHAGGSGVVARSVPLQRAPRGRVAEVVDEVERVSPAQNQGWVAVVTSV
jgi:hypothetical protein